MTDLISANPLTSVQNSIVLGLQKLRLPEMAKRFKELAADPAYADMDPEELLLRLINDQISQREFARINTLLRQSQMDDMTASLAEVEYHADRALDRQLLEGFGTCEYIRNHEHIILLGATGSGKTFISCALGNQACRAGYRTLWGRTDDILKNLDKGRLSGTYDKVLDKYTKPNLLILDEFLAYPLTPRAARDLFEITDRRTGKGSLILCTQHPVNSWYARLGESTEDELRDSIMDRIVHDAHQMLIKGEMSMRERHGLVNRMNSMKQE